MSKTSAFILWKIFWGGHTFKAEKSVETGKTDLTHALTSLQLFQCRSIKYFLSSVQSLSHVWLFVTPWTTACQVSLSIANSQSLLKLISIESVMPSNHYILCRPLLLPSSTFPTIRVFSNESVLHIRWSKYWSFSFSTSPSNEYSLHSVKCCYGISPFTY